MMGMRGEGGAWAEEGDASWARQEVVWAGGNPGASVGGSVEQRGWAAGGPDAVEGHGLFLWVTRDCGMPQAAPSHSGTFLHCCRG